MKDYLLLFRGGDSGRVDAQKNPEQWQAHMMKWKSWMEGLGQTGKLVSGQPFNPERPVINGSKQEKGSFLQVSLTMPPEP